MDFNKESFEKALKDNKIIRWEKHFENVVKSYLQAENDRRKGHRNINLITKKDESNG
jgi:hypothetical protein